MQPSEDQILAIKPYALQMTKSLSDTWNNQVDFLYAKRDLPQSSILMNALINFVGMATKPLDDQEMEIFLDSLFEVRRLHKKKEET